MSMMTSTTAVT